MAKVLLCTQDFPPVLNSAARLFSELAEDLREAGNEVTVLTRIPHRYLADANPSGRRGSKVIEEQHAHGRTIRVPNLPVPPRLPAARALEQWWMARAFERAASRLGHHDVVIVYSPPLPVALAALRIGRKWNAPVIANVQDLYPRTATDLGLLRNPALIKFAESMERRLYSESAAVVPHSEGNAAHVRSHGGRADSVHPIANWVDLDATSPGPRMNAWRTANGIGDEFIVSFAGTMGFAQGVQDIVEAATDLQDLKNMVVLLIGDGVFKKDLEQAVKQKGLKNVRFMPPQTGTDYVSVLQASDVSLVTLHKDLATPVVPGKLQSVMAAGGAAILYSHPASDGRTMLEESRSGMHVTAGDVSGLASAIRTMYNTPSETAEMGRNGRLFAESNFTRPSCTGRFVELVHDLTTPKERS